MKDKFIVELRVFDGHADDPHIEEAVVAEVTEFSADYVEVLFKDRNEQMYLRFQIRDLLAAAQSLHET